MEYENLWANAYCAAHADYLRFEATFAEVMAAYWALMEYLRAIE